MKRLIIFLVVIVAIHVGLDLVGAAEPEQQQAIIDGIDKLSWKQLVVYGILIFFPGLVAVTITMVWTTVHRRNNRAENEPPLKPKEIRNYSMKWGALFGIASQAGLQRLMSMLNGIPVMWELVPLAAILTGPFSMLAYECVKWYAYKKKWFKLYSFLVVKHVPGVHNIGDASPEMTAEEITIFTKDKTVREDMEEADVEAEDITIRSQ